VAAEDGRASAPFKLPAASAVFFFSMPSPLKPTAAAALAEFAMPLNGRFDPIASAG